MAKGTESLMYFVTAGFRNDYAELLFFHEKPNRNRNHGFYTLENRNRFENMKTEQLYVLCLLIGHSNGLSTKIH